jgi:UDP-glucose 4-epimerase
MKILVTGGAGYIGSHVTAMLVEQGHEVIVYDNLSAGFRDAVDPGATLVIGDLLDPAQLAALFEANARGDQPPFDGIMHFASHIQVGESMKDPFKYLHDNIGATMNLLEQTTRRSASRSTKPKRSSPAASTARPSTSASACSCGWIASTA